MTLIPKKYDPSFETEMYTRWKESGFFAPVKSKEAAFVVPLPPPNVTGDLHLGHAVMLALEDAMTRYARMHGKPTLWIPGTDHAGISTQVVVERNIQRDLKKTKHDLGRTAFLDEVWKWVRKSRSTITSQIASMGAGVDRSREQFTMSESLSRAVRKAFVTLYKSGKIYRDTYMVNRSPAAQTVLSDLEVEHKTEKTKLYYIKYFLDGKGESLTVATVRPETMFGDVAVAVNPKDRRYKKLVGKHVLIPVVNRSIPIIADESVAIDFGTGVLKITPSHAEEDFHIAKKHGLPLEMYSLDFHNRYTALAGADLEGKDAYAFMDNLIQLLGEIGNLDRIEEYETSVPYCERTGCRIQPMLSKQRFFDVSEAAAKVKKHIDAQDVVTHPEKFEKQFHHWLDQIKPRCISRQLRRGHRIPVRYNAAGEMLALDEDEAIPTNTKSTKKKTIFSKILFNLIADGRLTNPFTLEDCIDALLQPSLTPHRGLLYQVYADIYRIKYAKNKTLLAQVDEIEKIFASVGENANPKKIMQIGEQLLDLLESAVQVVASGDTYQLTYTAAGQQEHLQQDEDVLDTWFSSGLRPFSIMGRPESTPDLAKFYPATVLETGYDIIFFRVIRMMLMGVSLTDQMPFENVYLHGLIRAQDGQKMSKSKGNGVDPLDMVAKYGADALRGALILGNTPGNDQKFSEQKVEYMRRFINKIRNATRFVQGAFEIGDAATRKYADLAKTLLKEKNHLSEYDIWIINKLNEVIGMTSKYHDKFMLGEALQEVITFLRHDLCDRYIEIVKSEQTAMTPTVLLFVLGTSFKLLHPCCPFVTEKLRQLLGFDEPLITASWPTGIQIAAKNYRFNLLMEMITQRRVLRQDVTEQPHEEVILLVQGNKDIHLLVQEHTSLVKRILHASEIVVYNEQDEIPSTFLTGLLMDIKLGVQGQTKKDRKTTLAELEKVVVEEEQFLQRMRVTLSSNDFLSKAPADVVTERKQKMEEVKNKIVALQHEINRIKMDHK